MAEPKSDLEVKDRAEDPNDNLQTSSEKQNSTKKKSPGDSTRKTRHVRSAKRHTQLHGLMGALTLEKIENQPQGVGLVYDERMLEPRSLWDTKFPEKPERISSAWERCHHYGLVDRCVRIQAKMATEDDILLKHSQKHYDEVEASAAMTEEQLKELSTKYDSSYFHPKTYEASMVAVGSTIELTKNIVSGKIRHGMALIRTPGHHAQRDEPNGYCFFNNVAIAAEYALEHLGLERILIVDWDVHHGQGTQYMFYDDPRVLYFSIHRYEHGNFWPNLRESDYDCIGTGTAKGYNINVPFNKVGMTNGDYLAILQQVLMPVAYEFNPDLVLVSCGYDAALGDAEGLSDVTPAGYAHMTHMMQSLAGGRLGVVLEGGYCQKSQAEGVALTLKTLLGDVCPDLGPLDPPMSSTVESILQVVRVQRPYWKCFSYHKDAKTEGELPSYFADIEIPKEDVKFVNEETRPKSFPLTQDYEFHSPEKAEELDKLLDLVIAETKLLSPADSTCLVYDERMRKHRCLSGKEQFQTHPERPDRITYIFNKHRDCGLLEKCKVLESRFASDEELELVHSPDYIKQVRSFQHRSKKELNALEGTFKSVYLSHEVFECASLAVGCTLNLVDEVMTGKCRNGVAIVRPPGHHAEPHCAMGFCYFNSAAVAARYAQRHHGAKKVLILDWDVHHGNGTQLMFETDPSILYISLHRYDNGFFFPCSPDGDFDAVGIRDGLGFNVNIPWNNRSMGDAEYMAAFQQVVMPIAHEFGPDLVVVSAGFDAAKGDPLGGCRVTPECYGQMTHMLSGLANGRVILVLEGGYNLNSISESMVMCTSVLLGQSCPHLAPGQPCDSAIQSLCNVLDTHQKYWKSLQFRVNMPSRFETKKWLKATANTRPFEISGTDDNKNDTEASTDESQNGNTDNKAAESVEQPTDNMKAPPQIPSVDELTDKLANVTVKEEPTPPVVNEAAETTTSEDAGIDPAGNNEALLGACGGNAVQAASGACENKQEAMELFSVVPLPWCPHLKSVTPVPASGLDTRAPCKVCDNVGENWVCLACYEVHCSRYVNEHMLMHGLETEHRMVLSYADLSVWCYACDSYVHNEILFEAKQSAHRHKFGEDAPHH